MQSRDLSTILLFASLPAEEVRHLEAILSASSFPFDKALFYEGRSDDQLYNLPEEQMKVAISLGRLEEIFFGVCTSGNLLGENSLFTRDGC
jgi:hypothetical protein